MIETFFTSLEMSVPAVSLRSSLWVYPAVNAGHIIGIALLFGGVVPLDLRLIGTWPHIPLAPLLHVLTRTITLGIILTIACGVLLFITRASAYGASDIFSIKMIAVVVGLINGSILRLALSPTHPPQWVHESKIPAAVRLAAGISLVSWTTALVLGRLIGYVH